MNQGEDEPRSSNIRQGLALICIGAIGFLIGLAGRPDDDAQPFGEGPALGEQIAQVVGGIGGLLGLVGLGVLAWGLLRD